MGLTDIQSKIAKAESDAGRDAGAVTLIAVSKVQPLERVEEVLQQGHRVFGENRVQEAEGKWPAFKERFDGVQLHLIGPLQSNKVRPALELFDVIHTVDSEKLARRIKMIGDEIGRHPKLFIQVNTGDESQKAGVALGEVDDLVALCRELGLPLVGLMCIPPVDEEPSLHFALLAKIAARNRLAGLSMGMSDDFERAVALGATHVRVGSAIFGQRG
ncbi:YggS family pyridoxal phosphate-dependent enzyme [Actibacterium sp. XHP0104]|uniref:YggS family pyridoxal phosphate-dependent enzyme n=1 Tax=Actibacterium sp. XHP0104 TaxID=2984335 RepID=UPI0021E892EC|nr:YggS family pyridoxal phosphate-dependent enzyme [Actibacterium sp. XHP0104]MCV2881964.1 YggS family pyridoxal phosphate-dependent enzyme [Actibacterium sp. XHP0104]